MSNDLLKYISKYFDTFKQKDYTIYVNGNPTEWCNVNHCGDRVAWTIPSDSDESDWYYIFVCEINAIRLTPTTMEIIKTNGKEYTFTAKLKTKEKKAKEIILKAKNALYAHHINDAMGYLDELNALMDE